ncbi:MAG TPA: adenylate cyclase [Prolixibacteraceae bacterium]|jgi:CYTH domain-containing protein|nr:adenylate cyclase [Prolixibacteraceae bacterium]
MASEIERKFLVDTDKWAPADKGTRIIQAYLGLNPSPTVRIRIAGEKAFLTIKGRTETISRPEFEYEVPLEDGMDMLKLALSEPVEKTRYKIWQEGFLWEVDIFSGKNEGLVMAEIELQSVNQEFSRPDWLLMEVSSDERFYNSYLSIHPFQEWGNGMA